MKKIMTILMLALPLTACENNQELKLENARLVQENQDLKVKVARLEERAKPVTGTVTSAAATPAKVKAKPKTVATKAPEDASAAEKEALTQAATGGGSFK